MWFCNTKALSDNDEDTEYESHREDQSTDKSLYELLFCLIWSFLDFKMFLFGVIL